MIMRRIAYILLPLLLAACTTKPDTVKLTEWQFEYNGKWYPATVPGFIHTDLMVNGLIPDPYLATNEDSVQWVGDSVWVYQTTICKKSLPEGDTLWLVFDGLAGLADIRVANTHRQFEHLLWVPDADNMYRTYMFPFPNIEDTIIIRVKFLPLEDSLREADYDIPLPERRAFTRMAPYQPGWDWGPKLQTCGIWKSVYITNKRSGNPNNLNNPSTPNNLNNLNVELKQERDSIGQSFAFYRDGKPLFIKGANWIPVHSFPVDDSANRTRYRYLLCSAKEAGFNMLRVWGGGIYEHEYFYDLCDSLDLMVWQDFIFAGSPYPDNEEMLNNIDREVRQQVSRIARHPCVVLWCGNNEVKNGWEDWGWQDVYHWTPKQRARLEKAMDTIFGYSSTASNTSTTSILARAVHDCDPLQRPYITTSPLYGWGHPECVTHGDSHYWGVWWGELPFEVYKEKTGRFMSEYGFQSYPMLSSIKQFCPDDQLAIDSPTMRNHQKHSRGREIIDKAMQRYYGLDSRTLDLEEYAYVSQLLQAWGVGYGILCHMSGPRCAGTLYWQLNDCWPVASWSSIDYYGNWKALHYRAQALFGGEHGKWDEYYSVYPKDRQYDRPVYHFNQSWRSDGTLVVNFSAESDVYDVYLDTDPHIDGHFTRNFVDLKDGESFTTTFVPADPKVNQRDVTVTARTLNEVMRSHRK